MDNAAASEHVLKWEFWFTMVMIIHIIAGIIGLLTFWIPLVTKKGSYHHITGGMVFIGAMAIAVICGVIMTVMRMNDPIDPPPTRGHAAFFLYLCLFTIEAAWFGVRVYQLRRPPAGYTLGIEKFHAIIVVAFGVGCSFLGLLEKNLLYFLFPFIGIGLGISQYLFWQSWPYEDFRILMKAHMRSMITCVIASLTAFCVIAVPRMTGIHSDSLWLWFGPTVALLPVIYYWHHKLNA